MIPINKSFLLFLFLFLTSFLIEINHCQINNQILPWDIELAFSMKTFTQQEHPAISPNGQYLVYSVFTQPINSVSSKYPLEPRILPNGTPKSKVGSSLYIVNLMTKQQMLIDNIKGNAWKPSWSPDGKKIAFYSDSEGFPQLWIYEVETQKSFRPCEIMIKSKLWLGEEPIWSNDCNNVFVPVAILEQGKSIDDSSKQSHEGIKVYKTGKELDLILADPMSERNQFYINENNAALASININTGNYIMLVKADEIPRPSYLRLSPSQKLMTYLSVYQNKNISESQLYFDLVLLPSTGGAKKIIASDLEVPQQSNNYYGGTYQWHPTEDKLVYIKKGQIWLADFTNSMVGESNQIAKSIGEVQSDFLLYTPDGNSIFVKMKNSNNLALVSIVDDKSNLLAIDEQYKFQNIIRSSINSVWIPKIDNIALQVSLSGNEGAIMYLNILNGKSEIVDKYSSRTEIFQYIPKRNSILVNIEAPQTPTNLYFIDSKTFKREQITDLDPRLKEIKFGKWDLFETDIVRFDGKQIKVNTGILLPPGAEKGDKLPAICFIYSGSNLSQFVSRYAGGRPATIPAQLLATRGYAVILLDIPLSPPGKPGNPISDMTNAALPQIYHAAALGYIDINRVGIIGQSFGGYSTASIISETNLFKAAVAISGLYDHIGRFGAIREDGVDAVSYYETGQARMGTNPWSDLQRFIRNSPYLQVEKINTPLLLLHGRNDYTCDVSEPKKMFIAMKRLEKTCQLAIYDGEGHVVFEWSLANAVDATNRLITFFNKYLK